MVDTTKADGFSLPWATETPTQPDHHINLSRRFIDAVGWVPPRSPQAFLLAVVALAAASAIRVLFGTLGTVGVFAPYFPALLLVSLIAGTPAALAFMVTSVGVVWWAFIPPYHQFGPIDATGAITCSMYLLCGGCILVVSHWYREALLDLRRRNQEREVILAELEHRGRNTYAVIDAMVRKTLVGQPDLARTISGRIRTIRETNDLISRSATNSVSSRELIDVEVSAHGEQRLKAVGAEVQLTPHAARCMGLVFHELTTNAAKYGALASPSGNITVMWTREDGMVHLDWWEKGGPIVHEPTRRGFGSQLIVQSLKSVSGKAHKSFESDGLRCQIECDPDH